MNELACLSVQVTDNLNSGCLKQEGNVFHIVSPKAGAWLAPRSSRCSFLGSVLSPAPASRSDCRNAAVTTPGTTSRQDCTQRKRTIFPSVVILRLRSAPEPLADQNQVSCLSLQQSPTVSGTCRTGWNRSGLTPVLGMDRLPHSTCRRGGYLNKTPIPWRREERMLEMHSTGSASYQSGIRAGCCQEKTPLASPTCTYKTSSSSLDGRPQGKRGGKRRDADFRSAGADLGPKTSA